MRLRFIGNEYAQFKNFRRSPQLSFIYLKEALAHKSKRYIDHNPAGSAMIVMLLVSFFDGFQRTVPVCR